METKLLRYLELLLKIMESVTNSKKLTALESGEFNNISKNLIEFLIINPGGLIFLEDTKKIKACKLAVEKLFELYTSDELYEEILEGGFGGLLFNELDSYAYRIKNLNPIFFSIKPKNKEFNIYYNEAMRCWLYGLSNSSIIIMASLLENILKEKLKKFSQKELLEILKNIKHIGKNKKQISFKDIIDIAKSKEIISKKSRVSADNLRERRNKIVHKGLDIDSDEALKLLNDTKNIFEKLFN
jgi:hypothetical protein